MAQERQILTIVRVIALVFIVVSVGVIAYAAAYSDYFSGFSFSPYSTASHNTSEYHPQANYSLYVTADNCRINVAPSPNSSLMASVEVSNNLFRTAFADIQVTERTGSFTFDIITPQWVGTDATAYVYIPPGLNASVISVVTQNGAIIFDSPQPASASIVMETTNGNMNLEGGHFNGVTMQTTNGNIYLSASSFVNIIANTVNGNIESHFADHISTGSVSLTATNGNLNFYVNSTSNLTISASTVNGGITISTLTYTASQFTSRQFIGTVNSGGSSINLATVNGNVKLTGT